MKILVIDDDGDVRKFIVTTLTRENHTVFEAGDGNQGLQLLQEHKDISVVITDLIMPEKEGLETIIEIRSLLPAIKIMAISGGGKVGPDNYLVLADTLGADSTLKKPFTGKELLDALSNL
ncbi:response regulator [Chlorobium sp. BLA1]|uniref:response regulator n=1 Tax=Candidatus Chlorobium masyuteum TaxID=2716876 RepID=UPI0014202789|nr:response regulator [Candidatus Chlorobium masyuteum]NHQ59768.1 response regulator [Candidatus Chlorobium masyuteum]NTU44951.1 response regulator [Chlorobiaceae bacterium]